MRIVFSFFLMFLVLLSGMARADDAAAKDAAYLALADAAIAHPEQADWAALRLAFAESSFCLEGRELTPTQAFGDALQKAVTEKTPDATAAYKEIARQHMGDIAAHVMAYNAAMKDHPDFIDAKAEYSGIEGIIKALMKTGDGHSAQTAFVPITKEEQFILMKDFLRLSIDGKKLENSNGHTYDVFQITTKNGYKGDVFFQIDGRMHVDASKGGGITAQTTYDDAEFNKVFKRLAALPPAPQTDDEYMAAEAAAQANPAVADWQKFHSLYADTSFYRATDEMALDRNMRKLGEQAAASRKPEDIAALKAAAARYAGDPKVDIYMAFFYARYKDFPATDAEKDFVLKAANGMLNAIAHNGDGRTPETAFVTQTLTEQVLIVENGLKAKPVKISIMAKDGVVYNLVQAENPATGAKGGVYFRMDDREIRKTFAPAIAGAK